jgi:hypothetical protein
VNSNKNSVDGSFASRCCRIPKMINHMQITMSQRLFIHYWLTLCAVIACASAANLQIPTRINYQGKVQVSSTDFNGTGQFKFALVDSDGTTTFWSNDGTSVAGSEPAAPVSLVVAKGIYSLQLGDTSLANMMALAPTLFTNVDLRLRVWFSDGVAGSQLLTPDQRMASAGFAIMAGSVPDGSITPSKIAATPFLHIDSLGDLHVQSISTEPPPSPLNGSLILFYPEGPPSGITSRNITVVQSPEEQIKIVELPVGADHLPSFAAGSITISQLVVRRPISADKSWQVWAWRAATREGAGYRGTARLQYQKLSGVVLHEIALLDAFPVGYRIEHGTDGAIYETITLQPEQLTQGLP